MSPGLLSCRRPSDFSLKGKDIKRKDRLHAPASLLLGELRQEDLKFQASMGNLAGLISK